MDLHSHLLPGLDDGVKSMEESLSILRKFESFGFAKVITTPHIYQEYYPNTAEDILAAADELRAEMAAAGISILLEAAAEYYMDDHLMGILDRKEPILTFGKENYMLVETGFFTRPIMFDELIFKIKSRGYIPVLAHPERYLYLEGDLSWLAKIRSNGVKLQVSLPSLKAAYGHGSREIARMLIKRQMVDFFGSDIHRRSQVRVIEEALKTRIIPQTVLNNSLL